MEHWKSNPKGILPAKSIRLMDENGEPLGVMSFREAQDLALERNLDLIEVSAQANPPVFKIGDYGRLRYKDQKKKNELKKKQKIVLLKEIQLRGNIAENDYQVKLNNAKGFLENKDKVKVVLQFRGREIFFVQEGKKILDRFIEDLILLGKAENIPKLEGKRITVIISPLKTS